MGCGQKNFTLLYRCHQLLSGFLAKAQMTRVSSQSLLYANNKGDNEMIPQAVHRSGICLTAEDISPVVLWCVLACRRISRVCCFIDVYDVIISSTLCILFYPGVKVIGLNHSHCCFPVYACLLTKRYNAWHSKVLFSIMLRNYYIMGRLVGLVVSVCDYWSWGRGFDPRHFH